MNEFVGPLRQGVARIGRSGTKLHPVVDMVWSVGNGNFVKSLHFHCSCTGTNNGRAHNTAQIYWGHTNANCGNR